MLLRNVRVTNILKKSRFAAALFVSLCLLGCVRQQVVHYETDGWREGDLVLRSGYGVESRAVMTQGSSHYSHVGLLHYDSLKDEWMVVHAVPDERDDGGVDTIKADPIATFFMPSRAERGAIVRLDVDSALRHRAAREAIALVERHVKFDHDYSWTDTTRLYCTQLVQQCYLKAGVDVAQGRKQRIDAPGYHGDYVFPSDLLANPRTKVIFMY